MADPVTHAAMWGAAIGCIPPATASECAGKGEFSRWQPAAVAGCAGGVVGACVAAIGTWAGGSCIAGVVASAASALGVTALAVQDVQRRSEEFAVQAAIAGTATTATAGETGTGKVTNVHATVLRRALSVSGGYNPKSWMLKEEAHVRLHWVPPKEKVKADQYLVRYAYRDDMKSAVESRPKQIKLSKRVHTATVKHLPLKVYFFQVCLLEDDGTRVWSLPVRVDLTAGSISNRIPRKASGSQTS
mmetsp:Transcript_63027/g.150155  ORF Transcript_63027/g.150155 Transcript_63027/m.150155 type:complete len:245 (+) Transcript_63027:80-814(+)